MFGIKMSYQYLRIEDVGTSRIITLNRPEKRNALSRELIHELTSALRASVEDECKVVVIASTGPVFSAGHDLREVIGGSEHECRSLFQDCAGLMQTVARAPFAAIAEVQGLATAAGCQLVAACDLAVASDEARFATPGVLIGMFCSTPMVPLLRSIGRKRAMEMLLTGDPIDAGTAYEWGLVNRVVPPSELRRATLGIADRVSRGSAQAVASGKHLLYETAGCTESQAYGIAVDTMAADAKSDDGREGIAAVLEKRSPVWPSAQRIND
jgi:enoyl-CoA hydratase/carnithine racemase